MNILFLHPNFPAQFRHLAAALARDPRNKVVFGTARADGQMPGVHKVVYNTTRKPAKETHHYVRPLEAAVLQGQAVFRMAARLKSEGFVPDVVYGHSGWGPMLFIKDAFPQAKVLCYFEWFYHAHGTDADFDPDDTLKADDKLRIRIKNTPILMDLCTCDAGLTPTLWQHGQFPKECRDKIAVLHDGIDTDYFQPKRGATLRLPSGLDLSGVEEIVTYVSRGLEPYRGFPQFMRAVALLQERRKNCHVVVVGDDRVAYGKRHSSGKTYKELLLDELDLDPSRIHFTGLLPYAQFLQVLQASSAHVYLTRPFVLSWSMLEAMSAGCLVIASDTAPVTEIIRDRVNGILVDFFSPRDIADRVEEALDDPGSMQSIRAMARGTIKDRYDLSKLLPRHLRWIRQAMEQR